MILSWFERTHSKECVIKNTINDGQKHHKGLWKIFFIRVLAYLVMNAVIQMVPLLSNSSFTIRIFKLV